MTEDAFAVAPSTPHEIRFHLAGAALNGAVVLAGLVWLFAHGMPGWPWVLLAIFAGIYMADLVSGLLHWAFDTWFDEEITFLRRMVLQVREHHIYPNRIFRIRFLNDAGPLSWIAMILIAPIVFVSILFGGPIALCAVLAAVIFDVLLVTMLEFHKCGHRARQPRWIKLLQRTGLVLSTGHHSQHHQGNHDFNYCLINGWADRTLGRLGLFRALEWILARWTGAQPQRNDHEWLRRFGRTSLFLLLSMLASSVSAQPPTVFIKGGTLIDVHTGRQVPGSLIVVEGNRIKQVGREADIVVPREARVIDARGKWIIPGLMDMHAHITESRNIPLELYLANGVTTIRDPGGNLTFLRLARQEIDSGRRLGPRLFFSGYVLDGNPPLWPHLSIIADTEERAESAVHFLIDQGVDSIKVYNSITEPVLAAIVRTAHGRGVPVIGHVPRSMTMTRAVESGMDGLEHIRVTGRELLPLEEANKIDFLPFVEREALLWQRFDLESDKMKELVSFLATSKIFLGPTLTVDELSSFASYEDQAKDPNNRYLPREFVNEAETAPDVFRLPPELKDAAAEGFRKRLRFIGMCSRAGVQIIAGTDGVGTGILLPGFGLHHELELLAQAELTPIQVIQSATINAARALKRDRELGSIEEGKLADLVILGSDPLIDIRNASKIDGVMIGGRLLDRKSLDEILAQAEAAARKK